MPGLVTPTDAPTVLGTPTGAPTVQIPSPSGGGSDPRDPPTTKSRSKKTPTTRSRSPSTSRAKSKSDKPSDLLLSLPDDSAALDNPDLGPFLLKLARDTIASGDGPGKALEYAIRASKSFERRLSEGQPGSGAETPSLQLAMSLHVTAAIYCSLSRFSEAIPVLERAIGVPDVERGIDHSLAKFSGYMQLGDTHAMLGHVDQSITCYTEGLAIQVQAIGETDLRVAETCRYLAEAHVQAMQFDEAEKLCKKTLEIHREQSAPASVEEAADRRLMALICEAKGDFEMALEHLVLASMAMISNGKDQDVAQIDVSIGNTYLNLGRFDEAIFSYQKALTVFKSTKGDNHPLVASVFVRLADLYHKTGKLRESKSYCENALRIYMKPVPGTTSEEIAGGLTEISSIYEAVSEPDEAVKLLQKALSLLEDSSGQRSTIAGIEAQMGVMYYMIGRYEDAKKSFESAVTKLRDGGERKSAFFGVVLNQMGLTYVQLYKIDEAAALFEEARDILQKECGEFHSDTLGACSNLAATYDALGRVEDAIEILEYILKAREEKLGTANPDVEEEKSRLAELLKEAGRATNRKSKSLENLIGSNSQRARKETKKWPSLGFRS